MIPLLAQATQLPDNWNGLSVLIVGTVVVLGLVAGGLVVGYQMLRKALAEEMRLQRAADEEAQRVEVQSPLTVTQHVLYVPQQKHDELEADFREFCTRTDMRFQAMSAASSESREKIYKLIREEMSAMNTRITDLLGALRELKGEIKHLSK